MVAVSDGELTVPSGVLRHTRYSEGDQAIRDNLKVTLNVNLNNNLRGIRGGEV